MRITVDRDSVAMGDDVDSHLHELEVPDGATLDELFASAHPIDMGRAAWVAHWHGEPFAVWSGEWGAGRVWDDRLTHVSDLPIRESRGATLHFAYWSSLDADFLLERLRAGAPLDARALAEEWRPLAMARHERELRERERTVSERLLDDDTVRALMSFGAEVDLHTDRLCRFDVAGGRWVVQRTDTMTGIALPGSPVPRASVRPVGLAQGWVVALVGAAVSGRGAEALPAAIVESDVRRHTMWTVTRYVGERQELAQIWGTEDDVTWFQKTLGRSVSEIADAYRV